MSTIADEERAAKQRFLKESILDKGISAQKFSEFLTNMKDEPTEIDNWDIEELSNAVRLFEKSESEARNNEILASTNSHTPYTKFQCEPIEFIRVVRLDNQRSA